MNPLNVGTSILEAFGLARQREAAGDAEAASTLASEMVTLSEQPGFKRLLDELAPAHDLVYEMWLEGRPVTAEQQAFARLVRLLRSRPAALVTMARQILADAGRM